MSISHYKNKSTFRGTNQLYLKIGFVLPVPPDEVGLINQLNLIESLSLNKNVGMTIITPTSDPQPFDGLKIINIRNGINFPYKLIKAIREEKINCCLKLQLVNYSHNSGKCNHRKIYFKIQLIMELLSI